MSGGIADEPLARAVLRHLADTRGKDDAMGSLARTVLSGEAGLREAANNPWHAQGLAAAFAKSQRDLTAEDRARYEREARRLAGGEEERR
ncbi:hypothetical protein ACQP2X_13215 [Actinoplanes sp. CA-131856]